MTTHSEDQACMQGAITQAREAALRGEVPVGAVVTRDGEIVAWGANSMLGQSDPTAHAEIVALREAGRWLGNYRLTGLTLYTTVEPCLMCLGAAIHARVARLVYGCEDTKGGALSAGHKVDFSRLNHQVEITGGVEAEVASRLLVDFFKERREGKSEESYRGEVPKWS